VNPCSLPAAPDSGFTLVELLVATTIMGVVTTTLGFAVGGMLRSSTGARERVTRAHDTMMIGFQFPNDINAATTATAPGSAQCGSGTPVLTLTTSNVAGGGSATVWYGVDAGALVRAVCTGTSVASSARLVDRVTSPSASCQAWSTTAVPAAFVAVPCAPWSGVDRVVLSLTLPSTPGPAGGSSAPVRSLAVVGARS
jgi:prepilin-type N-terminal cleavage/methylation domain-containing protein